MKRRTAAVVASCVITGMVILLRLKDHDARNAASPAEPVENTARQAAGALPEGETTVPLVVTSVKVLPLLELPAPNPPDSNPGEVIESTHPAAARYQFDRLVGEWVTLLGRIGDAPAEVRSALKTQFRQEHALAIQAVEAASSGRIRFAETGENGYPAAIEPRTRSADGPPVISDSGPPAGGEAGIIKERIRQ